MVSARFRGKLPFEVFDALIEEKAVGCHLMNCGCRAPALATPSSGAFPQLVNGLGRRLAELHLGDETATPADCWTAP